MSRMTLLARAFDPTLAGWTAIAIAVTALIALIALGLLYAGIPVFGPVNDLINALNALLGALLAWQFHGLLQKGAPGLAIPLLALAWAGAAAIIANSVLVAFGRLHWMTGALYTALGFGLLGVWFLALNRVPLPGQIFPPGLTRLGTIAGVAMLFGLLATPLLLFRVSLAEQPLAGMIYVGAAAGWLLYPVWCWLVGRSLLAG